MPAIRYGEPLNVIVAAKGHPYLRDPFMAMFDALPGIDLTAYKHQLIERFSNPGVKDTVARLAFDASERIPKFMLPAVRDNLAAMAQMRKEPVLLVAPSAIILK